MVRKMMNMRWRKKEYRWNHAPNDHHLCEISDVTSGWASRCSWWADTWKIKGNKVKGQV